MKPFTNAEKVIYLIIDSIVFLGFIAFVYFNLGRTVEYFCPVMQKVYTTQLNYLAFAIFVFAYTGGYALCGFIKSSLANKCNAYQKRHENISIANESDKALIDTLEAKVKTLETALKSALDSNK